LDKAFREGNEAQQRRDFSRAEELYRKVIAGNPQYHGAHFNLALSLAAHGKLDDAIAECRKEEDVNAKEVRSYEMAATLLAMRGRQDEAIQEWHKLLKVDPANHDTSLKLSTLLSLQGKDAEAVSVLEDAMKASPDSTKLELALGQKYLKAGQIDQGVSLVQKAIENGTPSDDTAEMLNDAAYALAESKTHLDVAKQYAEKAIGQIEAESAAAGDSDDAFRFGSQFVAFWDTLGWVYFQMGDLTRASDFLLPAWVQGQRSAVGEHLGQAYEKMGRKKEAAKIYLQALAAQTSGSALVNSPILDPAARQKEYQKEHNEIVARYEKLTGLKYSSQIEIKRLPNGEWSKTPAEELLDQQKVKFSPTSKVSGTALVAIGFTAGKVESVRFKSGDGALQSISEQLKGVKFPMPFPPNSAARIVRFVKLSCNASGGCTAEIVNGSQLMLGFGVY
jgi:tetratricopeptide (TPR) repeat protein